MPLRKLLLVLAVLGGLMPWTAAWACNIPVFRYALERWRPDAYEVIVFHQGKLSVEDKKLVDQLSKAGEDGKANIDTVAVDLAGDVPELLRKLWQSQKDATLPWMIVRYPASLGIERPLWAGTPTKEIVPALIQSPARREITKRLLKGESTVWLIVETGDKKVDDATAALVQTELKKLEKGIMLPNQDEPQPPEPGQPPVKLLAEVPLRVSFSVLRVSRDDPAEKLLVAMLLNVDDDIAKMKGVPLMFPIFGRGRALDAFAGKGINADNIESVAQFLCGACSCTVKRLSPGADVLFAADWESILAAGERPAPEPPSKPGVPVAIPKPAVKPVAVAPLASATAVPSQPMDLWRYLWVAIPFAALMLVVTLTLRSEKGRETGS